MYLSRNAAGSPSCLHVSTRKKIPQYSLFFVYERATKLPLEPRIWLIQRLNGKIRRF